MIELRTLAYFVAVCRCESLAEAAGELGIAASTLSTAMKGLEAELGLELLRRSNSGLYPTAAARWLMRVAEPTLAAEAYARRAVAAPRRRAGRVLVVEVALDFTGGGASAAIQNAIDRLAEDEPDVFVDCVWTREKDLARPNGLALDAKAPSGRLLLEAAEPGARNRKNAVTLASDRWVLASRLPAGTRKPPSASDLAAGPIVVPALASPLDRQARRYLSRHKAGDVRPGADHPGELPRLLDEHSDAAVFVPQSMVSPRLGLRRVWAVAPEPPLITEIVARMPAPDALTRRFVGHLRRAFGQIRRPAAQRPAISMRQVEYFNIIQRVRRVSAAARGAGISQPALSEQLAKLEAALGERLFVRHGDGLTTSTAGDRFAKAAKLIERGYRRLGAIDPPAATPPGPNVAIGILPSVSQHGLLVSRIAEAVLEVQERHPALKLTVQEAPNGTLQDWVVRGLVGLAIVETSLPHLPRLPLGSSEALAVVVHQKYDPLPPGPVSLADVTRLPLALPTNRFGLRQLLEAAAEQHGAKIVPAMEIDALTMIAAVLARRRICTVLPPSAVRRELLQGELIAHPIVEPVIARRLFVIYSAERSLSAAERDVVNTLRARLSQPQD